MRSPVTDVCPVNRVDAGHFRRGGRCRCWTAPRVAALRVLFTGLAEGKAVYESNRTHLPGLLERPQKLTVYWQTRAWLERAGLVVTIPGLARAIAITDKGLDMARGLWPAD